MPEETHHDEAALTEFFAFETQRRQEAAQAAAQEFMGLRGMTPRASKSNGSAQQTRSVLRRPAAAVTPTTTYAKRKYIKKRPAAVVTVKKKPSRVC